MDFDVKVTYNCRNLQRMRVQAGLSQTQLAKATGLSRRLIQSYESGNRSVDTARIQTLLTICEALQCAMEDIVESQELAAKIRDYIANAKLKEEKHDENN